MAQFTWTFDAPTGTYKSHAMSMHLYEAALQKSVFMDFVRPVEGFGRKKGDTVTITRVANLAEPTSPVLTEGIRIPEDAMSISTLGITVQEIGRSVPFTSLSDDLSEFDIENMVQKRLRDQMKLSLDTLASSGFKMAQIIYTPTGLTSYQIATNGTPATQATENMDVFHVETIRDYLFDTLACPPWEGDDYMAIFRTLGLRGIKRDSAWEIWHQYTDPQAKYNSEVGKIEQVRFIETNHAMALSLKGAASCLGEGVVFGEDAVGMAEAMTPELRAAIPADFGRSKAVAWYGILAFSIIWNTANQGQARIIHVSST
jgi:N4-gp56 family major capsid protein